VNLVRHEVTEFEQIDLAHDNFLVETIAGASIRKPAFYRDQ